MAVTWLYIFDVWLRPINSNSFQSFFPNFSAQISEVAVLPFPFLGQFVYLSLLL